MAQKVLCELLLDKNLETRVLIALSATGNAKLACNEVDKVLLKKDVYFKDFSCKYNLERIKVNMEMKHGKITCILNAEGDIENLNEAIENIDDLVMYLQPEFTIINDDRNYLKYDKNILIEFFNEHQDLIDDLDIIYKKKGFDNYKLNIIKFFN